MNVYPRLDQQVLLRLLNEYRRYLIEGDTAVHRVREMVDDHVLAPGRISHSPVGVELVSEERLWGLRSSLRAIAESHGYPAVHPSGPSWAAYDRETAATLHDEMKIYPTDAGSRDVWAHFNGWLVPDLVLWRWSLDDATPEKGSARFGWGPRWFARNQMGRLWWRQEILGDTYSTGGLGEDQVVALFERTSLSFNPPLARAIAAAWLERRDGSGVNAEDLMRDAAKRLRRLLPFRSLYSLPPDILTDAVSHAFDESRSALEAQGSP